MIRIDDKGRCCGCGACAQACPVGCIALKADAEGFLYPSVDEEKCINCGRCERVCPILRADAGDIGAEGAREKPVAVGGWHKDEAVRQASSSGGAFTLFAMEILRRGGVVFGAVMNGKRAEHAMAETPEQLAAMRGSKYVQCAVGDAYTKAAAALKAGRPVLFTGTPCQTAGLLTFLGKRDENLYLVDFICHGVPSPMVLEKYMDSIEDKSKAKIVSFSFREKDHGWHPSGLQLGTRVKLSDGREIRRYPALRDTYMNGFLEDIYLRPCCYECRFKTIPKGTADMTIADFWGVDKAMPALNDGKGTSLVLIHNERGQALFDSVRDGFEYRECDFDRAVVKNPTVTHSAKPSAVRGRFFDALAQRGYDKAAGKYLSTPRTFVNKLSRMIGAKVEGTIHKAVGAGVKAATGKPSPALEDRIVQFIKFCMVGVTNAAVSYAVNIATLLLLRLIAPGFEYDYVVANTTAFLVAVYWSFYWNSRKVFHFDTQDRAARRKALLKTYVCYGFTGIVLNNILSTIWIRGLGISKLVAPLMNLIFTIPLNYLTNKKWAFADPAKKDGARR